MPLLRPSSTAAVSEWFESANMPIFTKSRKRRANLNSVQFHASDGRTGDDELILRKHNCYVQLWARFPPHLFAELHVNAGTRRLVSFG